MKAFRSEGIMKAYALEYSKRDVTDMNDGGVWQTRKPTKSESDLLYKLFYGAMLGMNWGEQNRGDSGRRDAIINAFEFEANLLLPKLNNYNTVYCRLKEYEREWEEQK